MNKERQPTNQQREIGTRKPQLKIQYEPDTQENIIKRAEKLQEIVEELEEAKFVPQEVMLKEFEV